MNINASVENGCLASFLFSAFHIAVNCSGVNPLWLNLAPENSTALHKCLTVGFTKVLAPNA
jgi:hypothetical protein